MEQSILLAKSTSTWNVRGFIFTFYGKLKETLNKYNVRYLRVMFNRLSHKP